MPSTDPARPTSDAHAGDAGDAAMAAILDDEIAAPERARGTPGEPAAARAVAGTRRALTARASQARPPSADPESPR